MNKKYFKSAYDKIQLSDEFKKTALERILNESAKPDDENYGVAQPVRIEKRKVSPWSYIAGICAAAGAIGLCAAVGIYLYKNPAPLDSSVASGESVADSQTSDIVPESSTTKLWNTSVAYMGGEDVLPFELSLDIPDGWVVYEPTENTGEPSDVRLLCGEETVATIGYSAFALPPDETEVSDYMQVYNGIMMGSVVNWGNDYYEVKNEGGVCSATCKKGVRDVETGEVAYTPAIVAYSEELFCYITIDFAEEQDMALLEDIADSVAFEPSDEGLSKLIAEQFDKRFEKLYMDGFCVSSQVNISTVALENNSRYRRLVIATYPQMKEYGATVFGVERYSFDEYGQRTAGGVVELAKNLTGGTEIDVYDSGESTLLCIKRYTPTARTDTLEYYAEMWSEINNEGLTEFLNLCKTYDGAGNVTSYDRHEFVQEQDDGYWEADVISEEVFNAECAYYRQLGGEKCTSFSLDADNNRELDDFFDVVLSSGYFPDYILSKMEQDAPVIPEKEEPVVDEPVQEQDNIEETAARIAKGFMLDHDTDEDWQVQAFTTPLYLHGTQDRIVILCCYNEDKTRNMTEVYFVGKDGSMSGHQALYGSAYEVKEVPQGLLLTIDIFAPDGSGSTCYYRLTDKEGLVGITISEGDMFDREHARDSSRTTRFTADYDYDGKPDDPFVLLYGRDKLEQYLADCMRVSLSQEDGELSQNIAKSFREQVPEIYGEVSVKVVEMRNDPNYERIVIMDYTGNTEGCMIFGTEGKSAKLLGAYPYTTSVEVGDGDKRSFIRLDSMEKTDDSTSITALYLALTADGLVSEGEYVCGVSDEGGETYGKVENGEVVTLTEKEHFEQTEALWHFGGGNGDVEYIFFDEGADGNLEEALSLPSDESVVAGYVVYEIAQAQHDNRFIG